VAWAITALWEALKMRPWLAKAIRSFQNEWHEAPWFVILMIAVVAFVGPSLLVGAWLAIRSAFG